MPTTQKLKERLLKKLKELFQLDQPDLDFGFYRIMRAKAQQVQEFLDIGLSKKIEDSFGNDANVDTGKKLEEVEQVLISQLGEDALNSDGSINDMFSDTPIGREYKQALNETTKVEDTDKSEAEIYDHLYRFFERYYDEGDFISLRYYSGETDTKAAPFAIPYNGEEVKLHWANADQYYIKTTEHFSNFSFDLQQGIQKLSAEDKQTSSGQQLSFANSVEDFTLKTHFQIVDATEGEHANVKASEASKRRFIIHQENPVAINYKGELVVNFEYKPLSNSYPIDSEEEKRLKEKYGVKNKRDYPVVWMSDRIIAETGNMPELKKYFDPLQILAPTENVKKRPIIAKYLSQYTARNTMDYFIHKDLGGFLRRELDFYIKNEIMHLDDIENADAPSVESYLSKIKILRLIARKLIDFLAQLENFQKKLWLKKKFVLETNYCLTLDRIPFQESMFEEIFENEAQLNEWRNLFDIDPKKLDKDYETKEWKEFLEMDEYKYLVLDTGFFDEEFKSRVLDAIENFDEQCDGLLIHSENFQALNLLQERYREQVKCIYIDPPYNTAASEIIYKNAYKHSSWLSLIWDRVLKSQFLLNQNSIICMTIDDVEFKELYQLTEQIYGKSNILAVVPIRINPSGRPTEKGFALTHEYAIFAAESKNAKIYKMPRTKAQLKRFKEKDSQSIFEWRNLRREGSNSDREDGERQYYPIFSDLSTGKIRVPKMKWYEDRREWVLLEAAKSHETVIWPINSKGYEKNWRWSEENLKKDYSQFLARVPKYGTPQVYYKYRPNLEGYTPLTLWSDKKYSATEYGTKPLKDLFEKSMFSYPKSIFAVSDCLSIMGIRDKSDSVLDYFAGSGTTGHAVINLNREDGGQRKYILVEMGDYFDTVLKPRIAKVVYSDKWKNGKPTNRNTGISHCFKYVRLESYEDTLNNLNLDTVPASSALMRNQELKEDYMLRYMLDVETRGSQSLLNIDAFADPESYTLKVKKPGSDEYVTKNIDLIESFNYLIGLRVDHIAAPQTFSTEFRRLEDPEVPKGQQTRLLLNGKIKQDNEGAWWFRKIEGWMPRYPSTPDNGLRDKTLIIWRKLTGDQEKDNLMLDEFFQESCIPNDDFDFDVVYVNASNNLSNLKQEGDTWKVRLIEEEFMKKMWDTESL